MGALSLPILLFLFDRPRIVFYIFTFVVFSNVDAYAPVPIFQPFALFMIVTLAVAVVRSRKLAVHSTRFAVLVLAFLLLSFQSIAVARDLDNALYIFDKLIKIIVYLLLTSQFVGDRREFRHFLVVMVAGMAANNLLPFIVPMPADYGGPSLIGSQGVFRYQGLLFEPNTIAFWQIFFIPLYIFLMKEYRRTAAAPVLFVGLLLVSMMVIVISFSRGAFISFAVLFLLFLYLERRNRIILISGILLIMIAVSIVPPAYIVRIESIIRGLADPSRDHPLYTRLVTIGVALKLSARNVFTGVGIGNFIHHAAHYTSYPLAVHNALLLIFSELGIFALGVFIAIVWYNMKILRELIGRRNDREVSLLGRMLLLQHAAVLVNSMFIPVSYDHILWYMLALPSFAAFAYRSPPTGRK